MPDATERAAVRVALNAQINARMAGGVESSILSIVREFGARGAGIDLRILTVPHFIEEMRAVAVDPARVYPFPIDLKRMAPPPLGLVGKMKAWLRPIVRRARAIRSGHPPNYDQPLPDPDKRLKAMGVQVVHFPFPSHFRTTLPFIYEPHDLQHRHYPDFFSPAELAWREEVFGAGCRKARYVVCGTRWTKADIVRQYAIDPRKVAVITRGSVNASSRLSAADAQQLIRNAGVPDGFAYYPAMTFPHKNHHRLFEALAALREAGITLPLVMTGRRCKPFHSKVEAAIAQHGLGGQVWYLGPVDEQLLTALFIGARFIVFPSLFEGLSQSLIESLKHGKAIAAAKQSSIPETVGSAGHLFDGLDVGDMVRALREMIESPGLVSSLEAAARAEIGRFAWEPAAVAFAAVYKSAARAPLSPEEQAALERALA